MRLPTSELLWRFAKEIAREGEEAGELIGGIDVVFQHVEREVVEAAERPDGDKEQGGYAKRWPLEKQQDRRDHTQEQEENPFRFDPGQVGQVFHAGELRRDGL